jgi:hypothetical protein
MREHEVNKLDNFICAWYADDTSICDELIDYHKTSKHKTPGMIVKREGEKYKVAEDKKVKDSVDCILQEQNLINKFFNFLNVPTDHYIAKYSWVNQYDAWNVVDRINVQHYKPGGGYHSWHTERNTHAYPACTRHMVFMTYLNDVTDGGETEFYHQKVKIKPVKGLTVIWPADWTFTHRGVTSPTQEKYIITGWYNFYDPQERR